MVRKSRETHPAETQNAFDPELMEVEKEVMMRSAHIRGTDCHYSFEALKSNAEKGYHKGTTYPVKPKNTIIKDSFAERMRQGNVHLAILDDAFELSRIDFSIVSDVKDHALVDNYRVTGLQLKGQPNDLKAIIDGQKYSATAREWLDISISVPLADHGNYVHRELLAAWTEIVMIEAEKYMHGNYDLVEPEEPELDPAQTKMQFEQPEEGLEVEQDDLTEV